MAGAQGNETFQHQDLHRTGTGLDCQQQPPGCLVLRIDSGSRRRCARRPGGAGRGGRGRQHGAVVRRRSASPRRRAALRDEAQRRNRIHRRTQTRRHADVGDSRSCTHLDGDGGGAGGRCAGAGAGMGRAGALGPGRIPLSPAHRERAGRCAGTAVAAPGAGVRATLLRRFSSLPGACAQKPRPFAGDSRPRTRGVRQPDRRFAGDRPAAQYRAGQRSADPAVGQEP